MINDNRNTILAVILSGLVLIAWQYFYNMPQMEKQRAAQQAQSEMAKIAPQAGTGAAPSAARRRPAQSSARAQHAGPAVDHGGRGQPRNRHRRVPRIKIDTPRLIGSISLKGARIDDLSLVQFRETVDPASPAIVLYSPSGTESPYYARFGWVPRRARRWNSRPEHHVAAGRHQQPDPRHPGDTEYDNRDSLTFSTPFPSTTVISSPSRTRSGISAMRRTRSIRWR